MIQSLEQGKDTCKNHLQKIAQFYLVDQPWVRICEECAINLILCGKKVDKDITPSQFENKILIIGLTEELKKTIEKCQTQSNILGQTIQQINNIYLQEIDQNMKQIDEVIKKMNRMRESLYQLYESNISYKINKLYDRQNELLFDTSILKNHLQSIQVNHYNLIMDNQQEYSQFQTKNSLIKSDIERAKTNIKNDNDQEVSVQIQQIKEVFHSKFNQFKQKNVISFQFNKNKEKEPISQESTKKQKPVLDENYSERIQKTGTKLVLRSQQKKQLNLRFSNKNSIMKKPRQSMKGIMNQLS